MKVIGFILIYCLFFSGCSTEVIPLVKKYEVEWELGVASKYLTSTTLPIVSPYVYYYKATSDGSLLMLFSLKKSDQLDEMFIVNVLSTGSIDKKIDLPSGLISIIDRNDTGYQCIFNSDYLKPDFTKFIISPELAIAQTAFVYQRPTTFHELKFTESSIFQLEYEAPYPGTRITKSDYSGKKQWSTRYTQKYIRPFSFAQTEGNLLLEFNSPFSLDTLTLTSIESANGAIKWTKEYTSKSLFNVEKFHVFRWYISGKLFIISQDAQAGTFYCVQIDQNTGATLQTFNIKYPQSISQLSLVLATKDGGLLLSGSDKPNTTTFYKTDRRGNIGWQGNFFDSSSAIETSNGDLYVVSNGYVFKLKAIY
jgi:hypothetical protein